jgi:GT2 family glycosyltransferase
LAPPDATHFLLLNPDTVVISPGWLERLVGVHEPGITSLGCVAHPISRADGYCLLIDRDVWEQAGGLDEHFQWWWSVTRLQASVLGAGQSVQAVRDHENLLRHLGGKSGDDWKGARGMDTSAEEVVSWFDGLPAVRILPNLDQVEARKS